MMWTKEFSNKLRYFLSKGIIAPLIEHYTEEALDDAELIKKVLAGEEDAKEALVKLYHRRLLTTAWHFLGPQDDEAEDMVQETFIAAFKGLERFEGRSSLYTWLNHICVNHCFTLLRKRKRLLATEREDLERLLAPAAETLKEAAAAEQQQRQRRQKLQEWIAKLGGNCAEILQLRIGEGLPMAEIKERLKVPLGTVASRLRRCQASLQQIARRS